jgi:site-specific recombinase XerD
MNIKIELANYSNKNKLQAIYIIVYLKGERVRINTGIKCQAEKWDPEKNRIKGSSKQINDDNLVIYNCKALVNEIFVRYRLQNKIKELTPSLLRKEYQNPSIAVDFYIFMRKMIEERRGELTDSSIKQHFAMLNKMERFQPKLFFSQLDAIFIEEFTRHLKADLKNSQATIHNTLKTLRTYCNMAKRRGIIKRTPFDEIRIKRPKSLPEYLDEKDLARLWQKYKSNFFSGTYQDILRAFLFCCFTGLRISDVTRATTDWVISGMLIFQPLKTKNIAPKLIKIPLTERALQLIKDSDNVNGKLFSLYSEPRMRKYIKEIATHCEIKKQISWHTSRHTFASLFIEKTNDVATLQQLLGHSNISQTMIYVHLNDSKKINQVSVFNDGLKLELCEK